MADQFNLPNFIFRCDTHGDKYYIPEYARARPAVQTMLSGKVWEEQTHNIVHAVQDYFPGSDIVHAGAFFGDMLPSFSRRKDGRVWAFEPVLDNYLFARQCVVGNRLDNVYLYHAALANSNGTLRMKTFNEKSNRHMGGGSKIVSRNSSEKHHEVVPCMMLDNFNFKFLSLIHLDVEGFELDVLFGGVENIRKWQPVILLESNDPHLRNIMENDLGYTYFSKTKHIHVWLSKKNERIQEHIIAEHL